MAHLISALREVLGPAGLIEEPADLAFAGPIAVPPGDRKPILPRALLCPATIEEISAVIAICNAYRQPIVPQGGLTGLVGGADVTCDEYALSLKRFAGVEEVDAEASTMTLRAGTVLQTAQDAARAFGFVLPVDLGSRGSCQMGGVVATNAGGYSVIRYGTLRANVVGIEAILADGTVLSHLNKTAKDNTGYALGQLLIGSEGTLGIITRVVIRLHPQPGPIQTALCSLPNYNSVSPLLGRAKARFNLAAFELMWRDHIVFCGGSDLFSSPPGHALLIEIEAETSAVEAFLENAYADGLIDNALVAQTENQARRFWDLRDIARPGRPLDNAINLDVSLPVGAMDKYVTRCKQALAELDPTIDSLFFGHIGDGNLHALIMPSCVEPNLEDQICAIAYGLVREFEGSISAEHGIGRSRRKWLDHSRSNSEISAMRAIKMALDPHDILNPGKVI